MPPDRSTTNRTTPSFALAANLSLPLSSHGPNHEPSLERGRACLICRSRKVKCNGAKPACSACARSASAHGEDPATVVCNYDEPVSGRGEKKTRSSGASKVAVLEAKIADLERVIAAAQDQQHREPPMLGSTSTSYQQDQTMAFFDAPFPQQPFSSSNFYSPIASVEALLNASTIPFASTLNELPNYNDPAGDLSQNYFAQNDSTSATSSRNFAPYTPPSVASPTTDPLLELFYPGWPSDLPSPALVSRLVETYFGRIHITTGMINKGRFLAALTLPPRHHDFPHKALLHAVLASAALMVSQDFFLGEDSYWSKEDITESPADYHGRKAKAAIEESVGSGVKLFHVLQAAVLMTFYYHAQAKFVQLWLLCGMCTRMCTPLGLNHLRPVPVDGAEQLRARPRQIKAALLPDTNDSEELYERSATFWFALSCDRFASASTGWAMSLDDSDITSLLPSPTTSYPVDDLSTSPLSLHNPSFLLSHPPDMVGALQLFFKAVVLLGRVTAWNQRIHLITNLNRGSRHPDEPSAPLDHRQTPSFKRLDADALTFRLSIPREFQIQFQTGPQDNRLWLVFALPHTATILLHEWFCTTAEGDLALARCLLSARAILNAIFSLLSSSFEVGLVAPCLLFCWTAAGRTLVRDLALKRMRGQLSEAEAIKVDVSTIIAAMRSVKTPIGDNIAATLKGLLENPEQCLPHTDLSHENLVYGPNSSTPYCAPTPDGLNLPSATPWYQSQRFSNYPNYQNSPGSVGTSNSPGGTFSSTSALSPVDYSSLFSATANLSEVSGNFADAERFKEMLMEMPDGVGPSSWFV